MRYKILVVFGFVFLAACQKVIDLHLKNDSGKYVIEGNITNLPGPYRVTVGKTGEVNADYVSSGVSGASVSVRDDAGNAEVLKEVQPGVYQGSVLQGVEGRTYYLSVSVGGANYTASSSMPHQVNLDSLYIVDVYNFSKMVKAVVPVFTDPAGQGNSYLFNETINGVLDKDLFYQNDDYTDGRTSSFSLLRPDPDSTLHVNDKVDVEMQCIDKAMYKYWFSVDQSSLGDGGTLASNPVTNITGGALGYFSAHTSQMKSILVK
jgi:hypothetical protein